MKILLSGDKGFIGQHLRNHLEELGHEVYGFDIKKSRVEAITYLPSVKAVFEKVKPEIVIHLAALAGVRHSAEVPDEYIFTNITGTYNMLEASVAHGVKKFLFASSSSVYGNTEKDSVETMVCDYQLSPYAISKAAGELICRYFSPKLPVVVFRPFTVYGENGRKDMVVGRIIESIKNKSKFSQFGNTERSYTNVHDLCDGVIRLLYYNPPNNFDIFNLGGSEITSLDEMVEIIKSQCPELEVEKLPKNDLDMQRSVADISKANKLLGYSPTHKIKDELIKLCSKAEQSK